MKHDNSTSLTHDDQFSGQENTGEVGSTPPPTSPSLSGLFHSSSSTAGARRAHLSATSRDARAGKYRDGTFDTLRFALNVHSKLREHDVKAKKTNKSTRRAQTSAKANLVDPDLESVSGVRI